jgi:hypothetical protein
MSPSKIVDSLNIGCFVYYRSDFPKQLLTIFSGKMKDAIFRLHFFPIHLANLKCNLNHFKLFFLDTFPPILKNEDLMV